MGSRHRGHIRCVTRLQRNRIDEVLRPTKQDVESALTRLKDGLTKYLWLQRSVLRRDVSVDAEFQRKFDGFYRVRRPLEWRREFFLLMEHSKSKPIEFADALRAIAATTGRTEASFASKLVATLDPSKPVVDKFVLVNFGLRLPTVGKSDRNDRVVDLYKLLCRKYEEMLRSDAGILMVQMFDKRYLHTDLTPLKKVDLILWQLRD
jgi:hypothetical protein